MKRAIILVSTLVVLWSSTGHAALAVPPWNPMHPTHPLSPSNPLRQVPSQEPGTLPETTGDFGGLVLGLLVVGGGLLAAGIWLKTRAK
jgi:hypothetical protein